MQGHACDFQNSAAITALDWSHGIPASQPRYECTQDFLANFIYYSLQILNIEKVWFSNKLLCPSLRIHVQIQTVLEKVCSTTKSLLYENVGMGKLAKSKS